MHCFPCFAFVLAQCMHCFSDLSGWTYNVYAQPTFFFFFFFDELSANIFHLCMISLKLNMSYLDFRKNLITGSLRFLTKNTYKISVLKTRPILWSINNFEKKKNQIPCKLGFQNPNKYAKTQPKLPNLKDLNFRRLTAIWK